jgi:4-hydroxy-tetrahydrodipicolinate reductase
MKIAIIGYGKMGKAVELAAKNAKHEVVAIIDSAAAESTAKEISAQNLNGAQVVIDFTHPDSALANIRKYGELKVNAVIGTTGWYESLPEVEKIVSASGIGLLYAGNFSVGVNTFYAVVAEAAKRLSSAGGFDVAVHEVHHTGKADAPSGTAREIANTILANFGGKQKILLDNAEQPVKPESLQVTSSRVGKVVGIHEVTFDGESDTITLTHSGKNRMGYAAGAVAAGEWLQGKHGVFTAKDWLGM